MNPRLASACRIAIMVASVLSSTYLAADEDKRTIAAQMVEANAAYLQAEAEMVGAVSSARVASAEINRVTEETRTIRLENDTTEIRLFYQKRAWNDQYRSAHKRPQPAPEALARYSLARKPQRVDLSPIRSRYSEQFWPTVLKGPEFAAERQRLHTLLTASATRSAGLGSDLHHEVQSSVRVMLKDLRGIIDDITPEEYVHAKRFLAGLAYEVRYPQNTCQLAAGE